MTGSGGASITGGCICGGDGWGAGACGLLAAGAAVGITDTGGGGGGSAILGTSPGASTDRPNTSLEPPDPVPPATGNPPGRPIDDDDAFATAGGFFAGAIAGAFPGNDGEPDAGRCVDVDVNGLAPSPKAGSGEAAEVVFDDEIVAADDADCGGALAFLKSPTAAGGVIFDTGWGALSGGFAVFSAAFAADTAAAETEAAARGATTAARGIGAVSVDSGVGFFPAMDDGLGLRPF